MSLAESEVLILPTALEFVEAAELREMINERRGMPLQLVAAGVTYLGTHCLQILLSAAELWRGQALPFNLIDPSTEFCDGLSRMGISPSDITSDMENT